MGPWGSFLLPFPCVVITGDLPPQQLCGAGGGSPTGPALPRWSRPHLYSLHAVLRGLGRHTLDLRLEPLPAEGHSHVPTLLDLRRGQHTPVQVVGQPCVSVSAWSPHTRLLQGPP